MNEQRYEAYLNLIERILKCSSEEKQRILDENQYLIDIELVQTMYQVAAILSGQGRQNDASFLQKIAANIANINKFEINRISEEVVRTFFSALLETIANCDGAPRVIYPIMSANLDKLDDNLVQLLESVPSPPIELATSLAKFSQLICQFPEGNIACNLEIAITGYKKVLLVYTSEVYPEKWAENQINLGLVYYKRILADKAQNLEDAIASFQLALQVFTLETFPQNWALIQNNLGLAYTYRICGDRETNLELAIVAYQDALKVRTREAYLEDWAITQNNLGIAYLSQMKGNKTQKLENTIAAFQSALQVFTPDTFPLYWAGAQNNLGRAYLSQSDGNDSENLEMAITAFKAALQVRIRFPQDRAQTQCNLGQAYRNHVQGDKAENLEQALAAYESALQAYTSQEFPQDWAETKYGLGEVYLHRIRGERAENLERAIACYQEALQYFNREVFPKKWATIQICLGEAYRNGISGDIAENLELAITANKAALEVLNQAEYPDSWALAKNNLGVAYNKRIRGKQAENIELAIAAFNEALQVRTREVLPEQWGNTQNNIGEAYRTRITGDQSENLEAAITSFQLALQVFTYEAFPQSWAMVQTNLASAYLFRIRGKRAENLERAIKSYKVTLQVYTKEAFSEQRASVQTNLGIAYSDRIEGNQTENLEQAIVCFDAALELYTKQAFPEQWATVQNNLGRVYSQIEGKCEQNYEAALATYKAALQVFTQQAFPPKWAGIQNNLGIVYRNQENIDELIRCFELALEIYKPSTFPVDCFTTGKNLGEATFAAGLWVKAIQGYNIAIEAVEQSRAWASNDQRKQEILSEAINVYAKIVQACINQGQLNRAVEYIERSKTRNLVENLATRDLLPKGDISQRAIKELQDLRREITVEQKRLETEMRRQNAELGSQEASTNLFSPNSHKLNHLLEQLDELIKREIQPHDPTFSLTQKIESISFEQIQQLFFDNQTALVEWYVLQDKFVTCIITKQNSTPIIWESSLQSFEELINWADDYLNCYYNDRNKWKTELGTRLHQLAKILQLDRILSLLLETCKQLILIPHLFLHLLPLHALPLDDGLCLLDRFPNGIRYAPSCQLLQIAQNQQRSSFQNLFAVQDPTEDLAYTNIEVSAIRSLFSVAKVMEKQQATKTAIYSENLSSAHCSHFSCHGEFNLQSSLESALLLANGDRLTLGEIFALNLNQCRLVTLSACETGLTDFTSLSDEYIGLPSGFLYAGSPSVVSSLWIVNDLSTAFLMVKFYQNLQAVHSVAVALNQAQLWLRDITKAELKAWMTANSLPLDPTMRQNFSKRLHKLQDDQKPFQDPFHWAAFCAVGK